MKEYTTLDYKENAKNDHSLILKNARAAFGHIQNITDIDVLCLRIKQLERFVTERNDALNLNAQQASKIVQLEKTLEKYQ